MHGVAVVDEILAEDRTELVEILQECGVKVPKGHGFLHSFGDELYEADLGYRVLAHDVIGLAVAVRVAENGGHGDGQVFHMTELAQPAPVAGDEHGPAARDPIHEERLVVPRVERAHDMSGPHDGDRSC